jgi:hypothetical protein
LTEHFLCCCFMLLFWLHWLWQLSLQGGGCAFWSSIGSLIILFNVHVVCNWFLPPSLFLTRSLPFLLTLSFSSFSPCSLSRSLPSFLSLLVHSLSSSSCLPLEWFVSFTSFPFLHEYLPRPFLCCLPDFTDCGNSPCRVRFEV